MASRIPPLGSVRAFDAAARHLSFTRAAAELGVTQAAVSWQIKSLEQRIGVPLFRRSGSGLALTATGQRLAPNVEDALVRLRAAFEAIVPKTATATIRVSAAPTFANMWLVPRLHGFHAAHPSILVDIDATGELADLAGGAADIAIRHGKGPWPGLICTRLLPVILLPVCSPRLAAGGRFPMSAETMARLPMLQPTHLYRPWFAARSEAGRLDTIRNAATFHQEHMAGNAAIASQGVAFVNPNFWTDALADGRLVPVAPELVVEDNDGYWLVYPDRPAVPDRTTAFRAWIVTEMAAASWPASIGGTPNA